MHWPITKMAQIMRPVRHDHPVKKRPTPPSFMSARYVSGIDLYWLGLGLGLGLGFA